MEDGMKQDELRQRATCAVCRKKLGQCGHFLFYVVTVERFALDQGAIQRQTGMEMLVGNPMIAAIMGPNEDLTKSLDKVTVTVCHRCSLEGDCLLPRLQEAEREESPA